jgi:hypothetical protein
MKGYLVSCSVPKSKQKRQLLCLVCVNKLRMGELKLNADAESVSLCNRGHGQQDALSSSARPRELEANAGADERAA